MTSDWARRTNQKHTFPTQDISSVFYPIWAPIFSIVAGDAQSSVFFRTHSAAWPDKSRSVRSTFTDPCLSLTKTKSLFGGWLCVAKSFTMHCALGNRCCSTGCQPKERWTILAADQVLTLSAPLAWQFSPRIKSLFSQVVATLPTT